MEPVRDAGNDARGAIPSATVNSGGKSTQLGSPHGAPPHLAPAAPDPPAKTSGTVDGTLFAGAAPAPPAGPAPSPEADVPPTAQPTPPPPHVALPQMGSTSPALMSTALDTSKVPGLVSQTLARADDELSSTRFAALPKVSGKAPTDLGASKTVLPKIEFKGNAVALAPGHGQPRYNSLKRLGAGAMGEVNLVEDKDIGRTVAVKKLHAEMKAHPGLLARFIDEIHTVGALEHPNIIPIHDVGVDENGEYFFVMKYIDGETLETVLERLRAGDPKAHEIYTPRRRIEIFIGILRALQYAHASGIIHRDIKPENIMIGRFGEVVVMDWGVARPADEPDRDLGERPTIGENDEEIETSFRASSTTMGMLIGTPLYMSPEQTKGPAGKVDQRSDLYTACVVLHEMLSLRHRFGEITELAPLLAAIQATDPPPAPKVFDPHPAQKENIPYEMTHFLRRGLRRDPSERWQSADEMIEELRRILDGKCRVQCTTTFLKRATSSLAQFVDKSPGAAILIAFGIVLSTIAWVIYRIVA